MFLDVVLIALCATLAGADDCVSMAAFAQTHEAWLKERLGLKLPKGVPSHDTLNRILATIDPREFGSCFVMWVESLCDTLKGKIRQIPIDGKTMRGTRKGRRSCKATHIVSAWSCEHGLTLAQVKTDEKSNEITAIPEVLRVLDLSGALVSIDAMGCQKDIAQQIVTQKGDYLLAVKDNQPRLFEDLQRLADRALETNYADLDTDLQNDTGHGRQEMRFCYVIEDLTSVRDRLLWPQLRSVVVVVSSRVVGGKASDEVRLYISSRKASAREFQKSVRAHWSIENACHWVLDVAFREDAHRLRVGHAPENMALIRKMALAMLKKADAKMGIKNKRLYAAWNPGFLEQIFRDFPAK
ncbi:Mobile element protein [Frigoriglobus tundricola]|uniref:Mobile element protein n=1 Tax=Frigoriglobus tundricola TaxID=2774151 RepID=A0A6M5YLK5_9BACT|nr:Mobile element protein [Frigoriglobus tundricola]